MVHLYVLMEHTTLSSKLCEYLSKNESKYVYQVNTNALSNHFNIITG